MLQAEKALAFRREEADRWRSGGVEPEDLDWRNENHRADEETEESRGVGSDVGEAECRDGAEGRGNRRSA